MHPEHRTGVPGPMPGRLAPIQRDSERPCVCDTKAYGMHHQCRVSTPTAVPLYKPLMSPNHAIRQQWRNPCTDHQRLRLCTGRSQAPNASSHISMPNRQQSANKAHASANQANAFAHTCLHLYAHAAATRHAQVHTYASVHIHTPVRKHTCVYTRQQTPT